MVSTRKGWWHLTGNSKTSPTIYYEWVTIFSVVAVVTFYLITLRCAAKTLPHQEDQLYAPYSALIQRREDNVNSEHSEEQSPRLYFDTIKTFLVRTIKSYRAVKPEVNVAMCFVRYAGLTPEERRRGRVLKSNEKDKYVEEITVKTLVRDIVHTCLMFLSDFTPEPVSGVFRMATTMWMMTKDMYKSVKQDEMGNCSIDYMSRRFWWWLGI